MGRKSGGRYGSIGNGSAERNPPVTDWEPEYLADAVTGVLSAGDAVMFGCTSDGGAVCVTIFDGDQRHKNYFSKPDELNQFFRALAQEARKHD